jgi:hypothetical protein
MAARKSCRRRFGRNWVIFGHMTNSFSRSPAAGIGALLAAATIPLHLLLSKMQSEQFAAVLLAVTARYTSDSACKRASAPDCNRVDGCYGILGSLGGSFRLPGPRIGICDYAHHRGSRLASIPSSLLAIPLWYPPFCAVADWVVAASLAVMFGGYVEPACLNA